jgi:hypothetical protein
LEFCLQVLAQELQGCCTYLDLKGPHSSR